MLTRTQKLRHENGMSVRVEETLETIAVRSPTNNVTYLAVKRPHANFEQTVLELVEQGYALTA